MKWNKWLWWNTPEKRLKLMLEIYSLLKSDIDKIYNEVDKGTLGFINIRPELKELALRSFPKYSNAFPQYHAFVYWYKIVKLIP